MGILIATHPYQHLVGPIFLILAILMLPDRGLVLNSGSATCCLKVNTGETNVGGKKKVALFRKLTTKEDDGLMSQRPSPQSRCSMKLSKGEGWEMVRRHV